MRIACVTETCPPEVNGVPLTCDRTAQHLRRSGHAVLRSFEQRLLQTAGRRARRRPQGAAIGPV
jgi:hypothetical protein